MQLFCFTFAGGTTAFYDELVTHTGTSVDMIKLEYSGHGTRRKEPFYHDFSELAMDLYERIKEKYDPNESYALMGYSMGSISAVEVLNKIMKEKEMNPPVHIFLAAHEPHTKVELVGYDDSEMDEFVKTRTIQFGGVPEKLINNNSFWRVYLPMYRSDYSIIGKYKFEALKLQCEIPVTVFYSETDTPLEEMQQWKRYFVGECEFIRYDGSHFFIKEHCKEMADVVLTRLNKQIK